MCGLPPNSSYLWPFPVDWRGLDADSPNCCSCTVVVLCFPPALKSFWHSGYVLVRWWVMPQCITLSPSIRKELGSLGSHKCDRHLSAGQCLSVNTGNLGILLKVQTQEQRKKMIYTGNRRDVSEGLKSSAYTFFLQIRANWMHNFVTSFLTV